MRIAILFFFLVGCAGLRKQSEMVDTGLRYPAIVAAMYQDCLKREPAAADSMESRGFKGQFSMKFLPSSKIVLDQLAVRAPDLEESLKKRSLFCQDAVKVAFNRAMKSVELKLNDPIEFNGEIFPFGAVKVVQGDSTKDMFIGVMDKKVQSGIKHEYLIRFSEPIAKNVKWWQEKSVMESGEGSFSHIVIDQALNFFFSPST